MKKTQRIMSAALTLLMLLSVFLIPSTAAFKNGDIVNYYLYTDIITYINNIPIRSYNIEGYTAVIVEDLANYGFDVVWSASARTLKVTRNTSKRIIGGFAPTPNTRLIGSRAGEVYYTDIITYFDGQAVKSYNIGGRTIAYVDDLADFYKHTYVWDGYARTLSLTLRGGPSPSPAPPPSAKLAISSQPKDVVANKSDPVSFQVTVKGGTAPYSYQWQTRQGNSGSWKNTSYTLNKMSIFVSEADLNNPNYYRCVITDSAGSKVTSNAVSVSSSQPSALSVSLTAENVSIFSNESLTISATVSGGKAPYKYQWYFGNSAGSYVGLTANTQTISFKPDPSQSTQYLKCAVIDANGTIAQSKPCKITLKDPQQLSAKLDKTAMTGSPSDLFSLTVTASGGSGLYSYKWYFGDSSGNFKDMTAYMSGADAPTLTTYPSPQYATQYYKCLVTDRTTNKSVFSDTCTMTLTGSIEKPLEAKLDKTYIIVGINDYFTLRVSVTGGISPYTYRWFFGDSSGNFSELNGTGVSGDSINLKPNPNHLTQYYKCLVIDNKGNMVLSDTCTVKLSSSSITPLKARLDNESLTVYKGDTYSITCMAEGGAGSYEYQWEFGMMYGGRVIFVESAFTTKTIHLTAIGGNRTFYYRCKVKDANNNSVVTNVCVVRDLDNP
ncbi:MAG: hypothetical protein GX897_05660 [Clostridiales bacterium]|nr:hypothetical protein [Clostridiales bacterium]